MQSFLQYRQIGQRLEHQIEGVKNNSHQRRTSSQKSSEATLKDEREPQHQVDTEKGRELGRGSFQDGHEEERLEELGCRVAERPEHPRSRTDAQPSVDDNEKKPEAIDEEGYGPDVSPPTASREKRHALSRTSTTRSIQTIGTRLGTALTGVDVRDRTAQEGGDSSRQVFVVGYHGVDDPTNPHNWPRTRRIFATMLVAAIGAIVGLASAIDASALKYAAEEFGVSEVAESLATGMTCCVT